MKANVLVVLGSLCVLLGAGSASAQCVTAGQHWTFSALGSGWDDVSLGMRASGKYWVPAICKDGVVYNTTSAYKYSMPALAADASVCTGAGNDHVSIIKPYTKYGCGAAVLEGIRDAGYELWISTEGDDDTVSAYYFGGDTRIWTGGGNDIVHGSLNNDFIVCDAGDDFAISYAGTDDMRGGYGKDWLINDNTIGTDFVLGEADNDCIESPAPASLGSSCGDGADSRYQYSEPLLSCETPVADCGDVAGPFL